MEKINQEKVNQNALDELDALLHVAEIEKLLLSIRLTGSRNLIGKAFEYDGKEYAIYGKGDYKGATIRVCCSDGRALDLNVECFYYKHSTIDDDMSGELGIDYEYKYHLSDGRKLIHSALDGVEIVNPKDYIFKLLGPKDKETTLNGFLLPNDVTLSPSGIVKGDMLVSYGADRIISEPMPTSNGYKKIEPLVGITMKDLSRIKSGDQSRATLIQDDIINELKRQLEEEIKKRVEERRETVDYELSKIRQMIDDKELLIEQIRTSSFTLEELRMINNCLCDKNIRDGIETR